MMAGTLHSMSSCPCRSRFIASQLNDTYETGGGGREPTQHAQSAHKPNLTAPAPEQEKQEEKREVTLTIGIFFDGTGNNAVNAANMMKACTAEHYHISGREAEMLLGKCARDKFGVSGIGATSYLGYYTNVHWLATLYKQYFLSMILRFSIPFILRVSELNPVNPTVLSDRDWGYPIRAFCQDRQSRSCYW
jgi:hypothetical protein